MGFPTRGVAPWPCRRGRPVIPRARCRPVGGRLGDRRRGGARQGVPLGQGVAQLVYESAVNCLGDQDAWLGFFSKNSAESTQIKKGVG
eukprot:2389293-Alexandrium_andersonii.AAC.1